MSLHITAETLSAAWVQVLDAVNSEPGGTATHAFVSVAAPQLGASPHVSDVVDGALYAQNNQAVGTVANTLFPVALYNDPGFEWSAMLSVEDEERLDVAATELYEAYLAALPTLRQVDANRRGTYFSRMISWPGKTKNGTNQLEARIAALRKQQRQRNPPATSNFTDIAVAGDADIEGGGIEEYALSDTRWQGFPCLVHIDISVREGKLSLLAVYRHWHLITRGYGNLVGLARLQEFLCQQTGFKPGELAVVAGHANAEREDYSGKSGVLDIVNDSNAALQSNEVAAAM
ncbi:hypothetical protein ASF72_19235 [Arthrobacter sp. Leaf141]|uniref:hypothetical protein n=1 Tax=Micrococcaceae TaxID=1268 RepID=UPI0006F6F7C1|nr:hypothetical protein [Arthrobacter sp. Leaf141]KQQ96070.1 hypothetical protein ASF72_19235 [Arthrobacter sp. Leaf141]